MNVNAKPHFTWILIVFAFLIGNISCKSSGKKYPDSSMYAFSSPAVIDLPAALNEISGLAYYAKDTSVFAVIDEDGLLFKISLNNPKNIQEWKFDKKRDYEDLVLIDSTFYILVSDGDIVTVKFDEEKKFLPEKESFKLLESGKEFEILFKSADSGFLSILCKECEVDSKNTLSSFHYSYVDSTGFEKSKVYDLSPWNQKEGQEKNLKPSAAAINPITKELYIISAIQTVIIIMDAKGNFKEYFRLNPKFFKQPEGITFTPDGDLIIANEFAEEGSANLLLMKNKLK